MNILMRNRIEEGKVGVMFKKKKADSTTDLQEIKPVKKKNKKLVKRIIIGAVIVIVLAIIILPKMFAPEVVPSVITEKAYVGNIEQVLSTSGFVESEDTKTYYSDTNAKITEFNLEKGSNVHNGDVLVAFDTQDLENQYEQQKLQNQASKSEYAQALADSSENATKYQNATTDVDVLEQQVEDQQNYVEGIQISLNDETNYLSDLNNSLAEYQAKLEKATADDKTSKIEKYTDKINNIEDKIKKSNDYSTDLNNNLISAQNELATLQSNLSEQKSIKSSSETGVLSGNEKSKITATEKVTELTLDQAKVNLEKAQAGINAEFDGIITDVQTTNGATVTQGTPLFTIASNEDVKLTVALTKYDLETVKEGQSAEITLGATTYKGTVTKISRVATTNSAGAAVINAEIHIDNPDDNIYLGVEAKVKINVGSASDVIQIPVECVNTDKEGTFCYVVDNGIVVKKSVTTGLTSDAYIEIKEGIAEGESVISDITTDIVEGEKVMAVTADGSPVVGEAQADNNASTNAESSDTENEDTENKDVENKDAENENADADNKDAENAETEDTQTDATPAQE